MAMQVQAPVVVGSSQAQQATATSNYPCASLYVGDLASDVTEAQLYTKFAQIGAVLSVRVCRDMVTRRSLGYAYVNYQRPQDAEQALDALNFELLNDRPMRIMWSQRDPSVRKSGLGNIYIKNLDKTIDDKMLYDTFSTFGNILSSKIALDSDGASKGYGFVHFETEEAAKNAIQKVNGMLLHEKKVYVNRFQSRNEREKELAEKSKTFTNVFIKNFGEDFEEEKLTELFSCFGKIVSCAVVKDTEVKSEDGTVSPDGSNSGKSKGFGFVSFEDSDSAQRAVDEMNGKEVNGRIIYVGRAQKKAERQKELKKKFEETKQEKHNKTQLTNLYIKNLEECIDDERLRKEFEHFGTITSAKVMYDDTRHKGFGFVCFSSPEEATRAVTEMNGRILVTKPLYVALAQRKEVRKSQLINQFIKMSSPMSHMPPQPMVPMHQMGMQSYMMPSVHQPPPRFFTPTQMRMQPRWQGMGAMGGVSHRPPRMGSSRMGHHMLSQNQTRAMGYPMNGMPPVAMVVPQVRQKFQFTQSVRNPTSQGMPGQMMPYQGTISQVMPNQATLTQGMPSHGVPSQGMPGQGMGSQPMASQVVPTQGMPTQGAPSQVMPSQGATNQEMPSQQIPNQIMGADGVMLPPQQAVHVSGEEPLTLNMLTAATHDQQKQMLGERLYKLIEPLYPELAGKITGMFLECDTEECLHMLVDKKSLEKKVEDAVKVLENHKKKLDSQKKGQKK